MYEQNGLLEIIEADPCTLSPVEALNGIVSENSLSLFDDKDVINQMLTTLIKAKPKNFDSMPYQERLKTEQIKS
jgi:hypothetical protein